MPDTVKKEEIPSWPAGAVVKQEHLPDAVKKKEIPSWPAGAVVKQGHLPDAVKKEEIPSWPAGAVVKQEHLSHIVKQEPPSHSEVVLARTPSSRNDRAVRRSRDRDARATADLPRRRETGSCTLITRPEMSELIKLESYCRRQARANGEPWRPKWTPPRLRGQGVHHRVARTERPAQSAPLVQHAYQTRTKALQELSVAGTQRQDGRPPGGGAAVGG